MGINKTKANQFVKWFNCMMEENQSWFNCMTIEVKKDAFFKDYEITITRTTFSKVELDRILPAWLTIGGNSSRWYITTDTTNGDENKVKLILY